MRSSFVLYAEYMEHIELLNMEQRGELFTAIFLYTSTGQVPELDGATAMAFSFIRKQLDKDQKKYDETCKKRSEAGKLGGRPKANGSSEKAKKANGFSEKQMKAKKADNDNENDNDLKESTLKSAKEKRFAPPTLDDVMGYCREKGYEIDCERFIDFYESKGWMIGKNRMKDWRAAVRNWVRQEKAAAPGAKDTKKANRFHNFPERDYDFDSLEAQLLGGQKGGPVDGT
mgnify:CR=1 FL=1